MSVFYYYYNHVPTILNRVSDKIPNDVSDKIPPLLA